MSSRRGRGNLSVPPANSSHKGKSVQCSSGDSNINQDGLRINSAQDEGDWQTVTDKSKSRTGAPKAWCPPSPTPKAWGPDTVQKLSKPNYGGAGKAFQGAEQGQTNEHKINAGRGNVRPQSSNAIPPSLQHRGTWAERNGSFHPQGRGNQGRGNPGTLYPQEYARGENFGSNGGGTHNQDDIDDEDDDDALAEDSDDDILSDGFESDESVKSHGTRKKNKWFKVFFESLDRLSIDQINETSQKWHCPACANGPGAIAWYSLQPLMHHAKTKRARKVKLHREFSELLDEELIQRGTSVIPSGGSFGKWEGLQQTVADHDIVWPPMVIIMNTKLDQDENDKWTGMGNQELIDYFSQYEPGKARHSYGPQGHRGMSVLIFETSVTGYSNAERLHRHFAEQGTDKDAWERRRKLFLPGGKRQLYGYMATKEDLDVFNQHCQAKAKVKFEMRSYHEMFVQPLKQMAETNQRATDLASKLESATRVKKQMGESLKTMSKQLRQTKQENRVVRERTKEQHEQNKEAMDYIEQFYKEKEQLDTDRTPEEKEKTFEGYKLRLEEIAQTGIEDFERERKELIKRHEDQKAEIERRYLEDIEELGREFEASLTGLAAKYAP